MSAVCNIMLSVGGIEFVGNGEGSRNLEKIAFYLDEHGGHSCLRALGQYFGGEKAAEVELYGGAFSGFWQDDQNEFITFVFTLPWRSLADVQIFIKDDNDERFRLINSFDWPELWPEHQQAKKKR